MYKITIVIFALDFLTMNRGNVNQYNHHFDLALFAVPDLDFDRASASPAASLPTR